MSNVLHNIKDTLTGHHHESGPSSKGPSGKAATTGAHDSKMANKMDPRVNADQVERTATDKVQRNSLRQSEGSTTGYAEGNAPQTTVKPNSGYDAPAGKIERDLDSRPDGNRSSGGSRGDLSPKARPTDNNKQGTGSQTAQTASGADQRDYGAAGAGGSSGRTSTAHANEAPKTSRGNDQRDYSTGADQCDCGPADAGGRFSRTGTAHANEAPKTARGNDEREYGTGADQCDCGAAAGASYGPAGTAHVNEAPKTASGNDQRDYGTGGTAENLGPTGVPHQNKSAEAASGVSQPGGHPTGQWGYGKSRQDYSTDKQDYGTDRRGYGKNRQDCCTDQQDYGTDQRGYGPYGTVSGIYGPIGTTHENSGDKDSHFYDRFQSKRTDAGRHNDTDGSTDHQASGGRGTSGTSRGAGFYDVPSEDISNVGKSKTDVTNNLKSDLDRVCADARELHSQY